MGAIFVCNLQEKQLVEMWVFFVLRMKVEVNFHRNPSLVMDV